jgi:hypothetical protein
MRARSSLGSVVMRRDAVAVFGNLRYAEGLDPTRRPARRPDLKRVKGVTARPKSGCADNEDYRSDGSCGGKLFASGLPFTERLYCASPACSGRIAKNAIRQAANRSPCR